MLSLVSTLPVFDHVHLIHTIASVGNRFELHNMSSRLAHYTSKHGDIFSYHIKYFLILSHFRYKGRRRGSGKLCGSVAGLHETVEA